MYRCCFFWLNGKSQNFGFLYSVRSILLLSNNFFKNEFTVVIFISIRFWLNRESLKFWFFFQKNMTYVIYRFDI